MITVQKLKISVYTYTIAQSPMPNDGKKFDYDSLTLKQHSFWLFNNVKWLFYWFEK